MALDTNIVGSNLDANGNLKVALAQATTPASVGAVRLFSENDTGSITGTPSLVSPETDTDFRLRTAQDTLLDFDRFTYANSNSGKYNLLLSTMTASFSAGGAVLNSGSATASGNSACLLSKAFFPVMGVSTLYVETLAAQQTAMGTNAIAEIGLGVTSGAPTDGAYFRISSAGVQCVINANGSEVAADAAGVALTVGHVYKFGISIGNGVVDFWLDDVLVGSLGRDTDLPITNSGGYWFAQVRNTNTASVALQLRLHGYAVSGTTAGHLSPETLQSALVGSYQGLGGQTMGGTHLYANSANPTAAVPTNTTAALAGGTHLGGQLWETDTLAVNTDGIISSWQNGSYNAVGGTPRRMAVYGVKIESYVQTTLTGGGYNAQWCVAFGHSAVSLATGESNTSRAPRRVPIGVQTVAAGATALTQLNTVQLTLKSPIIVNPGEFFQVVKKKVGTAPSAGVIAHVITVDYCNI